MNVSAQYGDGSVARSAAPPDHLTWRYSVAAGRCRMLASDTRDLLVGALRGADIVIAVASGLAAFRMRFPGDIPVEYWWQIAFAGVLAANFWHLLGVYSFASLARPGRHFAKLIAGWVLVLLFLICDMYLLRISHEVARGWMGIWFVLGAVSLGLVRVAAWVLIERSRSAGRLAINAVVIGVDHAAEAVARSLSLGAGGDMNIRGVLVVPGGAGGDRHREETAIADFFGSLAEPIDEIVIALPSHAMQPLHLLLRAVARIPANVTLSTGMGGISVAANDCWPGRAVRVSRRPIGGWSQIIKRSMDIVIALAGLICLAPLMAAIALAIKLDSRGPVLFRQARYGMNNQLLTILKFRTMQANAALDPTVPQARRNDPRVTRVGSFLRRSSLDELPQLINVLRGEMSLVGPRPHAIVHDEQYAATLERYLERHRVKPGITGWAQVNGFRGETDTIEKIQRRLAYDLYYIENWSLMLDLRILLLTLLIGIRQRNAY